MSKENLFKDFPPVSTEEWEKIINQDLKGDDYKQKLKWDTNEGVEALPFYRNEDRPLDQPILSPDHQWKICQPVYEQDIAEANQSARKAVKSGANALAFHAHTTSISGNIGPDMTGTAIHSQDDFSQLLDGIPLQQTEIHFNTGMLSPVFAAMFLNECEKNSINPTRITGSFGYNPFAFALKHNRLPHNKKEIISGLKQFTQFCTNHFSNMHSLSIDGSTFRNAGSTIVQELGYALATGSEYLAMIGKEAEAAFHFKLSIAGNYFLEIAKLRAARRLWPKILKAYDAEETGMIIHGTTANWNKSKTEPYTNIIRETTEAMAAAIGGCDTITVQPFDAIQQTPDEFSNRIARNTQLILKEEAYFDKVSDPSAGSWYIETLTDKIAEKAWSVFQEVEMEGGLLQSIKEGTLQTTIAESRKKKAEMVENEEQIFIGVNKYIAEGDAETDDLLPGDKTVSMKQTENGANIDWNKLISSIKEALNNEAAIGDIAPSLVDVGKLQFDPLTEYQIEEIEHG